MRPVRRTALALLAALLLSSLALAADATWRDSTRDVYVDGRLERGAQVLSADSGKRVALLLPGVNKALILDREASTFAAVPRKAFRVAADGASAELAPDAKPKPAGTFRKVDGSTSIVAWKGRTVLVARHQGLVGEVSETSLFAAVPVWRGLMDGYEPAPAAVAAIRKETRPVTMTVVLGTWCGDSKEFVPRILKSVRAASNPNVAVRLVALDNDFLQPQDVIGGRRIINVPTIILESDGRELGRITETPAGATAEEDVAAILAGNPPPHEGRYERGPEVARGTYLYRDAAGTRGEERWTIFARKDGGRLVKSRIETGDLVVEVFQGTDADGKLKFAEITKRQGQAVHRARFTVDGTRLRGHLRGREAGILQQDLVLPPSFAFASPAIAASGWMGGGVRAAAGPTSQLVCYVAPPGFDSPLGTTCVETHRFGGEEAITVPAGEFRATRLARQSGGESSDWWIHPDLGIPVRGQVAGGMEYVLASLVVP